MNNIAYIITYNNTTTYNTIFFIPLITKDLLTNIFVYNFSDENNTAT